MAVQTISFTEADWQRRVSDYTAWWKGQLDRPLVVCFGNKTGSGPSDTFYTPYNPQTSVEEIVSRIEQHLADIYFYGDAYPIFWPNFGPGLVSAMVGITDLHYAGQTIWFEPKNVKPLSEIHVRASLDNEWFNKIKEVTRLATERFGSLVQVAHTDLGGSLDLLAAYRRSENLLLDLIDCPDEVQRVNWESHKAWWTYYEELGDIIKTKCPGFSPWACTWAPGSTYILQCDFSCMISPDMFERFVLPELRASCKKLDFTFFHLDGPAMLPHLDHLLGIDELDGIQWVPGEGNPSPETWTDIIRRIHKAGKLVQLFTNCQGVLNAVSEHGGRGFMFYVTESLTPDHADKFTEQVNRICLNN